jgi:ribosomal protein L11 methyltransferase
MIDYLEIRLALPSEDSRAIVIAQLAEIGYDTFEETDDELLAYIPQASFHSQELSETLISLESMLGMSIPFSVYPVPGVNWNKEWESNFEPVLIEDSVQIRASFHPRVSGIEHDIVINPKMSFGTGHHDTTSLMISEMLSISLANMAVLDAGTGTGILAIMAYKLGATHIAAYDIDPWPVENTKENLTENGVPPIDLWQGTIADLHPDRRYDIVLANINLNVLLAELPAYTHCLNPGGRILLSGFYESDIPSLLSLASTCALRVVSTRTTDRAWSLLHFEKQA